jgi:hypothetical protein
MQKTGQAPGIHAPEPVPFFVTPKTGQAPEPVPFFASSETGQAPGILAPEPVPFPYPRLDFLATKKLRPS